MKNLTSCAAIATLFRGVKLDKKHILKNILTLCAIVRTIVLSTFMTSSTTCNRRVKLSPDQHARVGSHES